MADIQGGHRDALLAAARSGHGDNDHVVVPEANQRLPKFIHPFSLVSRSIPAGSATVAASRSSERMTRTGSASAAGSRWRRPFFLATRGIPIFQDMIA